MQLNNQLITYGLLAGSVISPLKANETTSEVLQSKEKTVYYLPLDKNGELDEYMLQKAINELKIDENLLVLQMFSKSVQENGWSDETFDLFTGMLKLKNPQSKEKIQAIKPLLKEMMTNPKIRKEIDNARTRTEELHRRIKMLTVGFLLFGLSFFKRNDFINGTLMGLSGGLIGTAIVSFIFQPRTFLEREIIDSQKATHQQIVQKTTQQINQMRQKIIQQEIERQRQ